MKTYFIFFVICFVLCFILPSEYIQYIWLGGIVIGALCDEIAKAYWTTKNNK